MRGITVERKSPLQAPSLPLAVDLGSVFGCGLTEELWFMAKLKVDSASVVRKVNSVMDVRHQEAAVMTEQSTFLLSCEPRVCAVWRVPGSITNLKSSTYFRNQEEKKGASEGRLQLLRCTLLIAKKLKDLRKCISGFVAPAFPLLTNTSACDHADFSPLQTHNLTSTKMNICLIGSKFIP